MTDLYKRILDLINEIEDFSLGNCSPSDDPDKQTAYLYSYKHLIKRFISSAKRLDDNSLLKMLNRIDPNPDNITEAYDLSADIQGVIDYINDSMKSNNKIKEKAFITGTKAKLIMDEIIEVLRSESANNLPRICTSYGLASGDVSEAFSSKRNYIYSRISHFTSESIFELAKKLKGKYPNSELDNLIISSYENDELGLISEFDNIQKLIKDEIENAKILIWAAVAWFTDKELANLLYKKSNEGVNIQLIIIDDKINSKYKEKFQKYFTTYLASKEVSNSLMHNKFCIFDLKTVIHGSYNWTNRAKYNDETISLIQSKETAEQFALEFNKLKLKLKET